MEFGILGPLRVHAAGEEIPVPGAKRRALLAVLLLHHRDAVVSAERLIDELWGDDPPATAAKGLQVHVSELRRALGDGQPIVTRPTGYAIELTPGALDLDQLRAPPRRGAPAARRRRPARGGGRPARRARAVPRARRWPTSSCSGARRRRPRGWTASGWRRSRTGWSWTSRSASTPPRSPSWRRSSPSTRIASSCTPT